MSKGDKPKPEGANGQHSAVVVATNPSHRLQELVKWVALAAVAVVVILGGRYLYDRWHKKTISGVAISTVCTTKQNIGLLKQAAVAVHTTNVNKLRPAVVKIQTLPEFASDANCLYPIVMYYIDTSDYSNTTKYLNEMKKVYEPSKGYNQVLSPTISMDILNKIDLRLSKSYAQVQKNTILLTVPDIVKNSGKKAK